MASAQTAFPLLKGCYKKTQRDCRPGTDAGAPRPVRARVPRPWLRAPRPGVVAPRPGRAAGVTLWACLYLSSDNVPNAVWIWDVQKLRLFVVLEQLSPVRAFQWDPQRPRLAICTGSSKVYLWSRAGCVSVQVPGEGEHGAPHTGDRGGSSARPPDILSTRVTGQRPHTLGRKARRVEVASGSCWATLTCLHTHGSGLHSGETLASPTNPLATGLPQGTSRCCLCAGI